MVFPREPKICYVGGYVKICRIQRPCLVTVWNKQATTSRGSQRLTTDAFISASGLHLILSPPSTNLFHIATTRPDHAMGTLTNVTTLLNSKLVRERHEGIAQLRSALATDHAADKLKSNDWIVLFTALFEAFLKEKQACRDKGLLHTTPTGAGAALIRRLTEVASAVRFLVEKGVKAFNTTLRKQVLDHVVTNIKHQGRLIDSIALDYVKSMKALLSYTPHLDHLGDRDWITLVQLSFNVILEDPFRKELEWSGRIIS